MFYHFSVAGIQPQYAQRDKKSRKIYFYDNGVRNAVIKNFNPLGLRQDMGQLWENFLMSERKKANCYAGRFVNSYFWRTHAQQEIDLVDETGGTLYAKEFKWNERAKAKQPGAFFLDYPNSQFGVVDRSNYLDFLL